MTTDRPDAMDTASGLTPSDPRFAMRRQRPAFVEGAKACRNAVLTPFEDQGLATAMRLALARRMAVANADMKVAGTYTEALSTAGGSDDEQAIAAGAAPADLPADAGVLVRHADLVTLRPREATADDVARLAAAGLTNPQIVALSELIAYVNFEVRIATGLRLLGTPGSTEKPDQPALMSVYTGFPLVRLKPLAWRPHIAPVELADATPSQLEAMRVTPSATKVSPYVRTLAHDPESYVARTVLFNAIMYVEDGLPRPDRELGALAASMVNGCRYCAVVHARRHAELSGSDATVSALYFARRATLPPREAAIVDFADVLSRAPQQAEAVHVQRLRAVGLSDPEILDLTHAAAIFGWANRLMHVLGEAVPT